MNTKKILTSLLATVLLAGAMTVSAWACEEAAEGTVSKWDGETYCTEWLSTGVANGQEGDTFYLNSAADLAGLSKVLYEWTPGNTNNPFQGDTFYLNVDIDLDNKEWLPIGTAVNKNGFEKGKWFGSFNGNGHTISNLKVTGEYQHAGLFGYTGGAAQKIENITLKNVTIENNVTKKPATGALVGRINSDAFVVSNVDLTGTVDIAGVQFTGGIAGYGKGKIVDCDVTATGTIHNSLNDVGGLVGIYYPLNNDTFVKDCTVNGGKSGLVISTDYGMIGGAIGYVSAGTAVTESVVDNISVENVTVIDASGAKAANIAYGYNATNSFAVNVEVENDEGTAIVPSDVAQTKAIVSVNDVYFTDLATAFKSVSEPATIEILSDITIDTAWQCNFGRGFSSGTFNNNEVTINGNGHIIKFTGKMTDGNTEAVISTGAPITVNKLTFDLSECPVYRRVISARTNAVINDCTFIGNPANTLTTYAVIVGESGGDMLANTTLTVTDSDFDDFSYGVSDNRNGQDIKSASVTDCIFENASALVSASTSIVFNNNKVESGKVLLYANENTSDLTVTAKGNTLDKDYENRIDDGKIIDTDNDFALPAVMIGANGYFTIEDAIASASSDDTITITAGTYDAFEVPATKNNLTFVGETAKTKAATGNLVTIKTLEDGIATHNGGVFVQAETTTFKNINFTAGTTLGASSGWMSSSLGNTNGDTGKSSSLKNLTVDSCNFTGSGVQYAIWTNQGNVTLTNCTITNYATAVDNYAIGADQKVVINDSVITDVYNAFHTGEAATGAQINVTGTEIDAEAINIGGGVAVTVADSTIRNADVTSYATSTFSVSESALYDTSFAVANDGKITLSAVYANNMNELTAANEASDKIDFITYYPTVEDLKDANVQPIAVPDIADAIYVKFEKADVENGIDTDEQADLYNINLVADAETINRLNSVDLTFVLTQKTGNNEFEIIASNDEIVINPVNNSTDRYEFHYDGKDGVKTDTGALITIGQVKFTGYGIYSFAVDATATTNAAHATTIGDNIVDTFLPNGDTATVADGELVIDDDTVTDILIAVPTRDLTINIDFPNAVKADNNYKYQDMKVVVSGGELSEAIVIDLGADATMPALTTEVKTTAKAEVAITDKYVVTLTDVLEVNNAYNVEVSGAGYRTVKYTVTMTEDKTLNFWNNVKDNETAIEEGKKTAKVTYLAGDIVKDNSINIYDLSAVVSYFGEIDLNAAGTANTYAKYDLNRDGKIDSKDVAYVLVSWNN